MIDIQNVSKKYDDKLALDNVSLQFLDNRIYGLLGSNGAGKSTLLKIISNRVFPTNGVVLVNDEVVTENEQVQRDIFCVTEKDKYPADIRLHELFKWEKRFYPNFDVEYANELAQKFDLDLKKKPNSLSTGYYTIFKVIVSLASNSKMLILDEPVLGIDSLYRELFYEVIVENQRRNQNLIIISTHLISEVEPVLQEVIIIDRGRVLSQGKLQDVTNGESLNDVYLEILKGARHGQ